MLSLTAPAVTPAEASEYLASRGLLGWPVAEPEQVTALRRGQDYIAGAYNHRWASEWENDDAPEAVKFAIAEAALREARSPGSLLADYTPADRVLMRREKLDVIEEQIQYSDRPASMQLSIPILDGLLRGLISGGNMNFRVTRG